MTKCPLCFTALAADRVAFVCRGSCQAFPDPVYERFHGAPIMTRPLTVMLRPPDARSWRLPTAVNCRNCNVPTSQEVCLACHYPLPDDWRKGQATCVALAGARSTGKTNCIAVMVQELRSLTVARGRPFSFVSGTRKAYEDEFLNPLYEQRGILPPTPRGVVKQLPPLIFSLGESQGVPRFLVLRDVAGEDLENGGTSEYLSFMARASLIVFLFDPTAVPTVRDLLRDLIPTHDVGGDPAMVLEHVQQLKSGGRPRLAVVLAKLDTLWHIGDLAREPGRASVAVDVLVSAMSNSGSSLRRALRAPDWARQQADQMLVHHEVRSLLLLLHAQELVRLVEHDKEVAECRYFAVSALGHPPDSMGLSPHGISPYRVLDPVIWALSEDGAL